MRKFVLGIVATLVVAAATVYVVSHFGLIDMRADQPSRLETSVAGRAMDASTERDAPQVKNPIEPTDANLQEGMKIYISYCAQCHGDPGMPESALGKAEYPPAPQFTRDPADMRENQELLYYSARSPRMGGRS
jgi:cytochrome c1